MSLLLPSPRARVIASGFMKSMRSVRRKARIARLARRQSTQSLACSSQLRIAVGYYRLAFATLMVLRQSRTVFCGSLLISILLDAVLVANRSRLDLILVASLPLLLGV